MNATHPPASDTESPHLGVTARNLWALLSRLSYYLRRGLLGKMMPVVVIVILINLYLAQGTYIHGQSMEPNLHTAQWLMLDKLSPRIHPPSRGEIVVFNVDASDLPLIKRVIALPGETIQIRDNQVYIDDRILHEPYLDVVEQEDFAPWTVPEGTIFVLGDNRSDSNDSRYFGPVSIERIIGRAWLSYWPVQDIQLIRRPHNIFFGGQYDKSPVFYSQSCCWPLSGGSGQ